MRPVWPFTLNVVRDTCINSLEFVEGCLSVGFRKFFCEFFIESLEGGDNCIMIHMQ